MTELLILLGFGIAGLYWHAAARAKEQASGRARHECQRCHVQLLDESVRLTKLSMSRDGEGTWRMWRQYEFEYATDGEERFKGHLTILGRRVIRVALEHFAPIIH